MGSRVGFRMQAVLHHLQAEGAPLTCRELADRHRVSPNTMHAVLCRLRALGMVRSERSQWRTDRWRGPGTGSAPALWFFVMTYEDWVNQEFRRTLEQGKD